MALMILIKFSRFKVYSKSNNLRLSAFPGKFPEGRKYITIFIPEL